MRGWRVRRKLSTSRKTTKLPEIRAGMSNSLAQNMSSSAQCLGFPRPQTGPRSLCSLVGKGDFLTENSLFPGRGAMGVFWYTKPSFPGMGIRGPVWGRGNPNSMPHPQNQKKTTFRETQTSTESFVHETVASPQQTSVVLRIFCLVSYLWEGVGAS